MSTITPTRPITPPAGPAAPPFADMYRMDIDEFERVADLLKAERVELIDGFIVERGAMDPPHVLSSEKLRRKLDRLLPDGWFVREDKPVQVHRTYEPLPDFAVVAGDPDTYENRHPAPADVAIVIEISDSTLTRDRGEKQVIDHNDMRLILSPPGALVEVEGLRGVSRSNRKRKNPMKIRIRSHVGLMALAAVALWGQSFQRAAAQVPEENRKQVVEALGTPFIVFRERVLDELKVSDEQKEKLMEYLMAQIMETGPFLDSLAKSGQEREKKLNEHRKTALEKLAKHLKEVLQPGQRNRFCQVTLQQEVLLCPRPGRRPERTEDHAGTTEEIHGRRAGPAKASRAPGETGAIRRQPRLDSTQNRTGPKGPRP